MKLLDHINRSIWLNEGDERSEIAANMHDYLKGWLTSEEPQYPTIEEMFQDLYAKLEDVSHDDIGSSSEHRNFMSNPVGLNFDNKGGVVDAVLSDVDLQNYLPTFNEGSNDGYYLEKDAMKLWLDDNPGKTERDWKYIGVDVQDEYTEKAGGEKGKYLGKGASEWTRTDRFGSDSTWTRTKESEEPLIPKVVSSDGQLVANDWDSAIELAQQLNIDAEELDYIEREGDSSSLLDFLHGHGYSIMEAEDDVDYKDMRAGEFAKAHGDQWREKSAEKEDAVAKMVAQALGDENRWDEMSAHELYSELESVDAEMADVVKMTAKLIHDVDLEESKAAKQ